MPPLASQFAFEVDRAIGRGFLPGPQVAGAWATIHELRPEETRAAFYGRGGPLSGFLTQTDVGGTLQSVVGGSPMATSPVGLGALASALGASAGAWRLP